MKVDLITGSVPSVRCGVEDYSGQLAECLDLPGVEVQLLRMTDWSLRGTREAIRAVRASRPDILHIQYPTLAYDASLGPHLLAAVAGVPLIVTLHEFSVFRAPKRSSMLIFALAASHILFTTDYERAAFLRRFPWVRKRSSVLPIGSNVPAGPHRPTPDTRILFFGQIRPDRGLEACIELARLAKARGRDWSFEIVGAALPAHGDYLRRLRAATADLPIGWHIDLDPAGVAEHLSKASVVYLPYPDGVSERRGTLMAALSNHAAIVTTDGPLRTGRMDGALRLANDPASALDMIDAILGNPIEAMALRQAAGRLARSYDWNVIGTEHRRLYASLVPVAGHPAAVRA